MMKRFILLITICGSLFFCTAATTTDQTLDQVLFHQARLALQLHEQTQFKLLCARLHGYVLYPYLIYWEMLQNIDHISRAQIDDFAQTYADVPLTQRLREAWLAHHAPVVVKPKVKVIPPVLNAAQLKAQLAIELARKHDPRAAMLLAQIPPAYVDHIVREWRVRTAIFQHNWPAVNMAIAQLTPEEQATTCWQFWHAYAAAQTHNVALAQMIYHKLANQVDYYGLLASQQLGQPYRPQNIAYPMSAATLTQVERLIAIQRAHELYNIHLLPDARREWDWQIGNLTKPQLRMAAYLAYAWGWYDRAIIAAAKGGDRNNLTVRFPLGYAQEIISTAKEFSVDPAWVFAIMRQESSFMADAKSSVGALGLMQVMPQTARLIAMNINLVMQKKTDYALLDADINIRLGSAYLKQLLGWYKGNYAMATAAYNVGPGALHKYLAAYNAQGPDIWIENLPWHETRDYVKSVLLAMAIYQQKITK